MKRIFIAAGEASGDLHAAALIDELNKIIPGCRLFGLGGELLRARGVELIYDLRDLAVAGFWEVAKRLPHFRRVFHDCVAAIERERPDCAILVDYPGLNLRLAEELKRRSIPVVYYIVPQVWAWKPGRIKKIEERVDLLLSILPFEKELFDPARVRCEFVGHPLLDHIETTTESGKFRTAHGIGSNVPVIALLPGSRETEVSKHYPIMLEAIKQLQGEYPTLVAATAVRRELRSELYTLPEELTGVKPLRVETERYEMLASATVSIVSSGTATLEAALCGRPFCVVYRTGWVTYQIARRVIRLSNVGLVNIVAGKTVVPEYIQHQMTAANLAAFCRRVIGNPAEEAQIASGLAGVRERLGAPGASARAAQLIAEAVLS